MQTKNLAAANVSVPGWVSEAVEAPYPGKGHDAWAVGSSGAAVVDGSTPLDPDAPNDLKAYCEDLAYELACSIPVDPHPLLQSALEILRYRYKPAGPARSAAGSVVRFRHGWIQVATLGDTKVVVDTTDGAVEVFDSRLTDLESAPWGMHPSAIHARRRAMNTATRFGYPIFADDPGAAEHAVVRAFPAASVKAIYLMSDGAWNVLPADPADLVAALAGKPLGDAFFAATADLSDDMTIVRLTRGTL